MLLWLVVTESLCAGVVWLHDKRTDGRLDTHLKVLWVSRVRFCLRPKRVLHTTAAVRGMRARERTGREKEGEKKVFDISDKLLRASSKIEEKTARQRWRKA